MPFEFKEPKKSLNSALLKQAVPQQEIEKLKKNFKVYLESEKPDEQEEYHKNLLRDLLTKTWYAPNSVTPKKSREDLVIYSENTAGSKPAVIIEVKSPHGNFPEMFSEKNQNCKALQECVLYFMQEFFLDENHEVKHVIITNYNEFYIFDAKNFVNFFCVKSNPIVAEFQKLSAKQLSDSTRKCFYENCAKPAIDRWIENEKITVIHFSMRDYCDANDKKLIQLYKILSPEFLLNKPLPNNSNTLNREFYNELLHIIGLEEVKEGNKKIIHRKSETKRESASLIESAMSRLEERISDENERFETALRLAITWINRLIFLKLVESQQLSYHQGESDCSKYEFLTTNLISNFHDLDDLFFKVLGRRPENRDVKLKEKFQFVPYLNSSLFELSEEETSYISINAIPDNEIPLFSQTVLKDERGKQRKGPMNILNYILAFLDAYDFSSRITENGIVENTKTLINASVLGLIFEKINGYKDGSFFTPPFITEYMAKETIERVIIQKFNDFNGWKCETLEELKDKIKDSLSENKEKTLVEANEIINSIRICDPAVGSGHFLVSVLNRILYIKSYLDILLDKNGGRIRRSDYEVQLDENDEISILDEKGKHFAYSINSERQLVQEAIFNEKRRIIENCLFGVDINPASVYICRLRLWIELLKNAYYTEESEFTQLETLPNIDINIKCGNSLISRYLVQTGTSLLNEGNPETKELIEKYRKQVAVYKNENNKNEKQKVKDLIMKIKNKVHSVAESEMGNETYNQKLTKNEDENIYNNSLEWMIEFPEVLDENGRFLGFDAVIGNPPYGIFDKKQNQNISLTAGDEVVDILRHRFPEAAEGMINAAKVFYLLGFQLAAKKGFVCMIIPFGILADTSSVKIRNNIFWNHSFLKIDAFPERDSTSRRVFEDAKMSTAILLSSNKRKNVPVNIGISFEKVIPQERAYFSFEDINAFSPEMMQIPMCDRTTFDMLMELRSRKDLLRFGDIAPSIEGEVHMTKCKPAITSDPSKTVLLKGAQIAKWFYKTDKFEVSQGEIEFIDLEKLKKVCSTEKISNASHERIVFQRLTGINEKHRLKATIIPAGIFIANSVNNLKYQTEYPVQFLLALFNSKLLNFIFKATSTSSNVNGYEIDALPFPKATEEQEKPIIDLVDQILAARAVDHNADTTALEAEIDKLVYELYGLTEDEIAIVEGKNI